MKSPWLSMDEVCALTGWTERHLRRLALDGKVEARDSGRRSRNGQQLREYALASLPDEARTQYLDGKTVPGSEDKPDGRPADSPSPLSLSPVLAAGDHTALSVQTPLRVALPPEAESEAARRMAILKPLLEYLRDRNSHTKYHQLALASGEKVSNSDSLARYMAEQSGISASTLWNWKRKFETGGSFALARKPRADKHRSAWAADNRELADLAALIYMGDGEQPAQSKTVAWEYVCQRAERIGTAAPSYETVRAFLENDKELSPSMRTYGREGRRKYDATFAPYMGREYSEPANSIWVSDHMIHDVLVQNDLFGDRDLKHIRIQMTTLLDYRSRYVVGVSWCENGSSHSIKRALLRAFTRYGLPDMFYCDNGKDYRKVARGARPQDFGAAKACLAEAEALSTSVMQRLGIPVTFCLPYHPQSKHIERYHLTVHERFDKSFTTYTSGATHLRPEAATAALARHGKLLQMGRAAESQLPLASEFIAMCEAWIEAWYHQQPQTGKGMDGRSPAEVFAQERAATQRPCPEIEVLAMLLCERTTRKVSNCAIELSVAGSSARFVPDQSDPYASYQMHERSGRRVTIAYDPLDPMFVAVLDEDLHFVCRLQREDLMRFSQDDDTQGRIQSFISNRNGLRKAVRESTQELSRRVRSAGGYTTLEEQHRERLQLPHAVGQNVVQSARPPIADAGIKETHSEDIADRYIARMGGLNGTL